MKLFAQRNAFTLVEIIVVMALTILLLVATLQSIIGSTAQFTFINSTERVLDLIRQARSLAISGKAQLDYTNFDKDGLTDIEGDYVTPAYYGIHFHQGNGVTNPDTVTLFADNHAVANQSFQEGKYDPSISGNQLQDYHNGADIILDQFQLPNGIRFSGLPAPEVTIFYSPILADVSFDKPLPFGQDPFFMFTIDQTTNFTNRSRCFQLHKLAGIPEPSSSCP